MNILAIGKRFGRSRRHDREFLPAALEILDTPPSPIGMALLMIICAFAVATLVWCYVSRVDIIAVAHGKLQPTGRVKIIQPLETSRVVAIKVENGQVVKAGEELVELDPSEAASDLASAEGDLASYRAEALRRQAAIEAVTGHKIAPSLSVAWPQSIPATTRRREERVYAADMQQLQAQDDSLRAQYDQKQAEVTRLRAMIVAQNELIDTLNQRVAMRTTLLSMNAGSKSNLLDAQELLDTQKTMLAQQKGQLAESIANEAVISKQIQQTKDTFVADSAQKLAEAERQVGDLMERRAKSALRLSRMILRSPIDGTVQASALTTLGQVVTSGQELMRIVPEGAALDIECYLANKDVGFVKAGDRAVIKIDSFPFTRYGTIDAAVVNVARDAIPAPEAEQLEFGEMRSVQSLSQSGAQRTEDLVFPIILKPKRTTIDVDGRVVPLSAGMAVTAEIRTGTRRVLEYLFSPVAKVGSEAMRER